jgi:hypothetical protein
MRHLKTFVSVAALLPALVINAHAAKPGRGACERGQAVTATRPICRYPLEARYSGHGEITEAANFTCREPM